MGVTSDQEAVRYLPITDLLLLYQQGSPGLMVSIIAYTVNNQVGRMMRSDDSSPSSPQHTLPSYRPSQNGGSFSDSLTFLSPTTKACVSIGNRPSPSNSSSRWTASNDKNCIVGRPQQLPWPTRMAYSGTGIFIS